MQGLFASLWCDRRVVGWTAQLATASPVRHHVLAKVGNDTPRIAKKVALVLDKIGKSE